MKITHLSNQCIIISRLMAVTGSANKLALSTVTGSLAHMQPVAPDKTMAIAGVPGRTYVMFLDCCTDIQENDQVKDEDGNIYTVRKGGVTKWIHGAMNYMEVYLTKT